MRSAEDTALTPERLVTARLPVPPSRPPIGVQECPPDGDGAAVALAPAELGWVAQPGRVRVSEELFLGRSDAVSAAGIEKIPRPARYGATPRSGAVLPEETTTYRMCRLRGRSGDHPDR